MANNRILRFHAPDKVFHSVNAITWFALLFTGVYVYFCEPEAACAEGETIHNMPGGVDSDQVYAALLVADQYGQRFLQEWE